MPLSGWIRKIGFIYSQSALVSSRAQLELAGSQAAGGPVKLKQLIKGHGWGLKYLVVPCGAAEPVCLIKAASRVIERRLARVLGNSYVQYSTRFEQEAKVLNAMAALNLGPKVSSCQAGFFIREFLPGESLVELAPGKIVEFLPAALQALENILSAGIFHSDPNAANLIVNPLAGSVKFIDCEVPSFRETTKSNAQARRIYCHERLLSSLERDLSQRGVSSAELTKELTKQTQAFYSAAEHSAIEPERVAALLRAQARPVENPDNNEKI